MKKSIFIIIVFLLCLSCSKIIEVDFPDLEQKLVIESLFCPDSTFRVFVSKTTDFNDSNVYFIDDATCKLYANNGFLFELQYQDTGFYIAPEKYKPVPGVLYKIEISHPELPDVWAEDIIPIYLPKLNNTSIHDSVQYIADETGYYYSLLKFNFSDLTNVENFYELEMFERDDSLGYCSIDTLIFGEDTIIYNIGWSQHVIPYGSDPVILTEGLIDFHPKKYPFSDILFDGQNHSFEIQYCPKVYHKNINDTKISFIAFYTYFVKIRSVSEAYYNYRKKLILHENNQQGDFWTG
ncbi:MAG: DUF4249 domain-containing protein, partial [Bacteroidales bacterium]|nr:DUF4249 domain-containing protein [Bacteroidales bacterium]